MASSILDVHNVECSGVALAVDESANTAGAATTSDENLGSKVELDVLEDLACSNKQRCSKSWFNAHKGLHAPDSRSILMLSPTATLGSG